MSREEERTPPHPERSIDRGLAIASSVREPANRDVAGPRAADRSTESAPARPLLLLLLLLLPPPGPAHARVHA